MSRLDMSLWWHKLRDEARIQPVDPALTTATVDEPCATVARQPNFRVIARLPHTMTAGREFVRLMAFRRQIDNRLESLAEVLDPQLQHDGRYRWAP